MLAGLFLVTVRIYKNFIKVLFFYDVVVNLNGKVLLNTLGLNKKSINIEVSISSINYLNKIPVLL